MTITKRIVSAIFANGTGVGISALYQLMTVPVLTSAWGLDRFGLWLVLSTIPIYLALSDMGFGSAATSDMTMHAARGQTERVLCTFQSVWLLVNAMIAISLLLTVIIIEVASLLPSAVLASFLKEHGLTILLSVAYSATVMNVRVLLAAFRATQNYALGTMLFDFTTLLEAIGLLSAASLGAGFELCFLVLFTIRGANFLAMLVILRRRVCWLSLGYRHAHLAELKRLWRPAIAALSIPGVLAISLQGMIVIAGVLVSTAAAGTLSPVRTISRVAIQVIGSINRATMPEISAAGARQNRSALAKLIALNVASVLFLLVPGMVLFSIFGSRIVEFWTNSKVHPAPIFVTLIALASAAHGLWFYTSNILLAFNEHTRIAKLLVVTTLVSIGLAIPLAHWGGLNGIAIAVLTTELLCVFVTMQAALRMQLISWESLSSALRLGFLRT